MNDLQTYLERLARNGRAGDRLPTIRRLMREFSLSQERVQQALEALRGKGLITAHVGRGTFIREATAGADASIADQQAENVPAAGPRSVLILSRVVRTARSERVLQQLHDAFDARGVASLQVTYNNEGHAIKTLTGLPSFDGCIVQTHFEPLPVALLSVLAARSRVIVFDGGTTIGIDADYVASNWRGAIDVAANHLWRGGHRAIGLITHDHPSRPVDSVHQHFSSWAGWTGASPEHFPVGLLPDAPARTTAGEIAATLTRVLSGPLRPSAVLVWGAAQADLVGAALDRLGIVVPGDLSIILLGHVDVEEEHRQRFTVVGSRADEATRALLDTLSGRLAGGRAPHAGAFLPVHMADFGSVATG